MVNSLNLETDVKDIKEHLIKISKMIEELLYEREIVSIMKLADRSLSDLFEGEDDLYKIEDLKVRYR